ncbi:hypothetical protein AAG570_012578 [Ranatra chinensis]|uniref:Transposase n=1 Tax=Ranatra chinensis TaxID=642074 RepID=A0ABD0YE96_9HEMI
MTKVLCREKCSSVNSTEYRANRNSRKCGDEQQYVWIKMTFGARRRVSDSQNSNLEFTEDPFRDYRYEDPFTNIDPFDDTSSVEEFGVDPFTPVKAGAFQMGRFKSDEQLIDLSKKKNSVLDFGVEDKFHFWFRVFKHNGVCSACLRLLNASVALSDHRGLLSHILGRVDQLMEARSFFSGALKIFVDLVCNMGKRPSIDVDLAKTFVPEILPF